MALKKKIKNTLLQMIYKSGFARVLAGFGGNNFLTALNYHRVDYPENRPWLDPSLISATPEQFEEQMRLLRRDYCPISIDDVLSAIDGQKTLPKRAVLVTVDDGYRDFKEYIFPIAARYDIQPLLFVPTAYPEAGVFWWDKLYWALQNWDADTLETAYGNYDLSTPAKREIALKLLRAKIKAGDFREGMGLVDTLYKGSKPKAKSDTTDIINWDELRELGRKGVCVAAHTHSHPLLTRIPFDEACAEIKESQENIQKEMDKAFPVFAFPDGQPDFFSPKLIRFLEAEGIKFAVTTIDKNVQLTKENALFFPRVGVFRKLSLAAFAYRLTPLYQLLGK
ncbi:MAG: polysaccharide deacetylase family protein [Chloroflexi bacterium]|nr:polysaccharide deacetylase family protein [Chloroflexota bacterium]